MLVPLLPEDTTDPPNVTTVSDMQSARKHFINHRVTDERPYDPRPYDSRYSRGHDDDRRGGGRYREERGPRDYERGGRDYDRGYRDYDRRYDDRRY